MDIDEYELPTDLCVIPPTVVPALLIFMVLRLINFLINCARYSLCQRVEMPLPPIQETSYEL